MTNPHFSFLDNFRPCKIKIHGKTYPSVEHYYQSQKTLSPKEREKIKFARTAGKAKKLGRESKLRKDWNKIKVSVLGKALYAKFTQHPELRKRLLSTGNSILIENNPLDPYWGTGPDGKGKNMTGKLLMELRERLSK